MVDNIEEQLVIKRDENNNVKNPKKNHKAKVKFMKQS